MWKKGSYTVEAAMLMGILIPLILAVIYIGFYLHDKAFLQGAALETIVYASLNYSDPEEKVNVKNMGDRLTQGKTTGVRKPESSISLYKDSISAEYREKIKLPGIISNYVLGGSITINIKKEMSLKSPGETIRKMKGLQKLMEKEK